MKSLSDSQSYFNCVSQTIEKLPLMVIERVSEMLLAAYERRRTVFLFGNGGSAALASHFACDLGKGTVNGSRKRFQVVALTDNVPVITAWANDSNYEDIFSEQLLNLARSQDVAFAISGSGNSPNVLKALNTARQEEMFTIGLTGFAGGKMKELCDACIIIPSENMQVIEDLHLCVAHSLFTSLRSKFAQHVSSDLRVPSAMFVRASAK
jgi:D-sedoheptulose 7-phosphate isomerase